MDAEIITIGDEILIGQIIDTNSAWLADRLGKAGIKISRITSIGDNADEITSTIRKAMSRSRLVFTTGGLGPTRDDITTKTLAAIFGCKLIEHKPSLELIEKMLAARGIAFNTLNRSQAMVPECCRVILNRYGTAPGMWFDRENSVLVSMPGVPFEMKEMVEKDILEMLANRFDLPVNTHMTIRTFGLPESELAEKIREWEDSLPANFHLAYLPSPVGIRLRLSVYGDSSGSGKGSESTSSAESAKFAELRNIIPEYIVGLSELSIEQTVGSLLVSRGETVSTAESCTGGNVAHRFTSNAGSSAYFVGGIVSYSNSIKENLLGVDAETIGEHGAVSREVAEQMAEGVRKATGSTYGISTTGVAGPDGGTAEKPIGTVWIAVAAPQGTVSRKLTLGTLREINIELASSHAINLLRQYIIDQNNL